jgi:hypothetical protein
MKRSGVHVAITSGCRHHAYNPQSHVQLQNHAAFRIFLLPASRGMTISKKMNRKVLVRQLCAPDFAFGKIRALF